MGKSRQFITTLDRNNLRVFICISFILDFINFFHGIGVCTAIICRVFELSVNDNCPSVLINIDNFEWRIRSKQSTVGEARKKFQ